MKIFIFIIVFLGVSIIPVFRESRLEYLKITNPSFYELEVDNNVFLIPYETDADVIAMEIDPELTSFHIAVKTTQDFVFVIGLDHHLISATNNEFAILVNGKEVSYPIVSDGVSLTFTFFVPEHTEKIKIIGTHVIPEFLIGVIMIFSIVLTLVLVMSRTKIHLSKL